MLVSNWNVGTQSNTLDVMWWTNQLPEDFRYKQRLLQPMQLCDDTTQLTFSALARSQCNLRTIPPAEVSKFLHIKDYFKHQYCTEKHK